MMILFQDVWCRRPEIREKEVDPLFRGGHRHHLLRRALRLRPGPGWGRGDEQVRHWDSETVRPCNIGHGGDKKSELVALCPCYVVMEVIPGDKLVSELSIAAISWHRTIILRSRHLNPNTDQQFITAKCMFLLWSGPAGGGEVNNTFYYFFFHRSTLG